MGRARFKNMATTAVLALLTTTSSASSVLPVLLSQEASATGEAWLTADSLQLQNLRDGLTVRDMPRSSNHGLGCGERDLEIRSEGLLGLRDRVTTQQCVVETEYGLVGGSSYLQRSGTQVAGYVQEPSGAQAVMIPVPRTADLMTIDKSAPDNTVYLGVYRDLHDGIRTTNQINGTVTHRLLNSPDVWVRNKAGDRQGVRSTTLSFSQNAEYMVADIPSLGLSRIDRRSLAIQPFARFPITRANWHTAVSNSGRYAVVADYEYDIFRLYDVATCPGPELAMYQQCQYLDLRAYMKQEVPGYRGAASHVSFINEYSLDFYGARYDSGSQILAHYSLRIGDSDHGYGYLGMGDSFASGEGAYFYRMGTDMADNRCHTSSRSYPFLVGQQAGVGQFQSVACSGARIGDVRTNDEESYDKFWSQAKGMGGKEYDATIYGSFLPGYRQQLNFVSRYEPTAVTLSAGGNDIGFADIVVSCAMPGTCYEYREDREQLLTLIDNQFDRLTQLYSELQTVGQKDRIRIYVVGYPQVADPEGSCAANVHLNRGELYFANEMVSYLNGVIKLAAQKAGVQYVDVEHALDGARFCETDSWNIAINGLTAGEGAVSWTGSLGPIAKESYHPNEQGHRLMAEEISAQTHHLTRSMPDPQPDIWLDRDHSELPMIRNARRHDDSSPQRRAYLQVYDNEVRTVQVNQTTELSELGRTYGLAPSETYAVELHSEPIQLGTVTTDERGVATPSILVPTSTPTGIHTVHILGRNAAGEAVDLSAAIYVDGDEMGGACGIVPASGEDVDGDGVDDACDAIIGVAETEPEVSPAENQGNESTGSLPAASLWPHANTDREDGVPTNMTASVSGSRPLDVTSDYELHNDTARNLASITPKLIPPVTRTLRRHWIVWLGVFVGVLWLWRRRVARRTDGS